MAKRPGNKGGPPPQNKPQGKQVQIPHDALVAQLNAMNAAGDFQKVMDFGAKQPAVVGSSPALMSAYADAARGLKLWDQAEELRRKVLAMEPDHPATINNLIVLLIRRDAYEEAETLARELVARNADHIEARYNLSLILLNTGRREEALKEARAVLARKGEHMMAHFVVGLALLGLGRLAEGWPEFEARVHPVNAKGNIAPPPVAYPAWRGEPLHGRSILIWMEQGLGDEIMMARYAAELKSRGAAKVTLVCKPAMAPLFRHLKGVDDFYVAEGQFTLPLHDYWTYPMSVPFGCRTTLETIPANIPYLAPSDAARTAAAGLRGPTGAGLWVGLVWKGAAILVNDHNRSLPNLETLRPLWDVPGLGFFSLQKGQGEEQAAAPPADQPLVDLAPQLTDLDRAAAFIGRMDVVVTVDTSIAHLAGALGKPCLLMLPAIAQDWRWMDRDYSPWYPSMTLFRQKTPKDWGPVIAEVAADLARRVRASDRI